MSISSRLNEFRKQVPPTQTHASALAGCKQGIVRAYKRLGPNVHRCLLHGDAELSEKEAGMGSRFYREAVYPAIREMDKKGIFLAFDSKSAKLTTADIFHRDSIAGCQVSFLANSQESSVSTGMGEPAQAVLPANAQYSYSLAPDENRLKKEDMHVFADRAGARIGRESAILRATLGGSMESAIRRHPPEKVLSAWAKEHSLPSDPVAASLLSAEAYCVLSRHLFFGNAPRLEDALAQHMLHEIGHMVFTRNLPERAHDVSEQEHFAYWYALANSPIPHVAFSDYVQKASATIGWNPTLQELISLRVVDTCNFRLSGENACKFPISGASILSYLQTPGERILSVAREAFATICNVCGIAKERLPENPVEEVRKVLFG